MSAFTSGQPAPVLCYGHGFFGSRSELENAEIRAFGADAGAVMIAIDWLGMSDDDIGAVVQAIGGEVSRSLEFGDRVIQGMVNWQVVTHAVRTGLLSRQPAFHRPVEQPDAAARVRGDDVIDEAAPLSFMGISEGHVLGGTLSALNADFRRNVLQVGGAAFTTLMFRARPFDRFLFLLSVSLPDFLDEQKLAAQMQTHFDRFDPASFAPYVIGGPLPWGPDNGADGRHVLVQMGIGDAQVPNLGSELHARLLGIPLLEPSPKQVYGLDGAELPRDGSGFMVFDLGVDPGFYKHAEPAAEGNYVHEAVRRTPEVRQQVSTFLDSGVIENPCDGACTLQVDPDGIPTG